MAAGTFSVTLEDLKQQTNKFGVEEKDSAKFFLKNGEKQMTLTLKRNTSKENQSKNEQNWKQRKGD